MCVIMEAIMYFISQMFSAGCFGNDNQGRIQKCESSILHLILIFTKSTTIAQLLLLPSGLVLDR